MTATPSGSHPTRRQPAQIKEELLPKNFKDCLRDTLEDLFYLSFKYKRGAPDKLEPGCACPVASFLASPEMRNIQSDFCSLGYALVLEDCVIKSS